MTVAMAGFDLLSPEQALAHVSRALPQGTLGPLAGVALIVVRADSGPALDRLVSLTPTLPCVVVAVGDGSAPAPAVDVAVAEDPAAGESWVGAVDDDRLQRLAAAVGEFPSAAVTLAQLLRVNARLPALEGLVAESLAYGLLQSGPEHARWRAARPEPVTRAEPPDPPVLLERSATVATVTLNRPHARNAYNVAMRDALAEALRWVTDDPSVTELRLRGAGPSFCSGGDLTEFGSVPDPVTGHNVRMTRSVAASLIALADRTVAYVHGACVGAGLELPAFARQIVAAPDATFRLPERGMGLLPGAGGTVSIPRRIGRSRAAWLALSGEAVDAPTALRWGLVDAIE